MGFYNKIFIIIVLAICLYAAFLIFSDFSTIKDKLENFRLTYLPFILIIVPCSWIALFVRWHLLLRNVGIHIPIKHSAKIYFAGFALAITPGKFGELIKSQLIKKRFDVPRTSTVPLVFAERLYDLVGAVAVSFVGILALGLGAYIIIGAAILLIFIFVLLRIRKLFEMFLKIFEKNRFTSKFVIQLSESYDAINGSTRGKILVSSSLLTIVYWSIEAIAVYLVVLSFGIDKLSYLNVLATYTSSLILGAVSFIPGGIGVADGSMVGLFNYQGVDLPNAFVLVVLIRFFTIWYSVIVGFVALKLSNGFSLFSDSKQQT